MTSQKQIRAAMSRVRVDSEALSAAFDALARAAVDAERRLQDFMQAFSAARTRDRRTS